MPITPHNIIRHELIGLHCTVSKSANKKQEGLDGTIVDETRNTVVMETNGKVSRIAKADAEFIISLPGGRKARVSGSLLVARPENRIKLKLKKW